MYRDDPHFQLTPDLPGWHLPWIQSLRSQAVQGFFRQGFPAACEEDWKYTNFAPIEKKRFTPTPAGEKNPVDPELSARCRLADAWCLVFVDGRFSVPLSDTVGLPGGVLASSLAEALKLRPEQVEGSLRQALVGPLDGFGDFTAAYFGDGAFLRIPANTVLDRPLQILHLSTRDQGQSVMWHRIDLGRNAKATVVETYAGIAGTESLNVGITEISLDENARLCHYKFQAEADKAYHIGSIHVAQAESARFYQHHTALGGLLARTEIYCDLRLSAECELDGLFLATGRKHLDTLTRIRHLEPQGKSRETYRGIATDRGRGVFAGRIEVEKDAQKTDAEMSNRNLLLSENAEIDSKPQLKIDADDVKCSHGLTVGQLDPDAVFYLESRGIDEAAARNMLTFAFANEMVEKIRLESLKTLVRAELLAALPETDVRRDWL